jgi:hypothetical protein
VSGGTPPLASSLLAVSSVVFFEVRRRGSTSRRAQSGGVTQREPLCANGGREWNQWQSEQIARTVSDDVAGDEQQEGYVKQRAAATRHRVGSSLSPQARVWVQTREGAVRQN